MGALRILCLLVLFTGCGGVEPGSKPCKGAACDGGEEPGGDGDEDGGDPGGADADGGDPGCGEACAPSCGNHVEELGEACDDGNDEDDDACIDCVLATCGDGFVRAGVEDCDDQNDVELDACTSACEDSGCGPDDDDGDGVHDGCDLCPGADDATADLDGDEICAASDGCPFFDPTQDDSDVDGTPDACEPLDPHFFFQVTQSDAGIANEAGDRFGAALATGDFDGDGFDDLVVGAPLEDVGSTESGAVTLFFGSPTGIGNGDFIDQTLSAAANEDGDGFGAALAAGDFDDDGFDDLVVGTPGEATDAGQVVHSGVVHVFAGGAGGLAAGVLFQQPQAGGTNQDGDELGAALATGDFDGDGYDDLAIGAPGDGAGAGSFYLFAGSDAGLTTGVPFDQADGSGAVEAGDRFGAALAAGDFDGDGHDDQAVGAPGEGVNAGPLGGAVFVFFGGTLGLGTGSFVSEADLGGTVEDGDELGASLAAGDLDGDGFADLVMGAPGNAADVGRLYVRFGSDAGLGLTATVVHQGMAAGAEEAGDRFGAALVCADFDDDGDDDLVIGTPGEAPGADPKAGVFTLLEGSATSAPLGVAHLFTQNTLAAIGATGDELGWALTAGDFDGDGAADLAAGSPGDAPPSQPAAGSVFVVRGLAPAPRVVLGPLLGGASSTGVRIWARTNRAVRLAVDFGASGSGSSSRSAEVVTGPASDQTGVVVLSGLTAGTSYDYQLVVDGAPVPGLGGSFRTLPPPVDATQAVLVVGADMHSAYQPFDVLSLMLADAPDAALLVGDIIYADSPGLIPDRRAAYANKYRRNWADGPFSELARQVPLYLMLDDHEIQNDWDGGQSGRYVNARWAYDRYTSLNPPPLTAGATYYAFRAGPADVFVMDVRSHRSPSSNSDGPSKTMLGATQLDALLDWLSASTAPFKLLVSTVPWDPWSTTGTDAWRGYLFERDTIFDFIAAQEIPGVVLISGDQHWAGVFALDDLGTYPLYELMPTPLAVSNRTAPSTVDARILYRDDSGLFYGRITVDGAASPPELLFELVEDDGDVGYTLAVDLDDLTP